MSPNFLKQHVIPIFTKAVFAWNYRTNPTSLQPQEEGKKKGYVHSEHSLLSPKPNSLLFFFNHWFHVSVSHFLMHPLRPLSWIIKIKLTMERFEGILPSCRAQGKLPERYSTGKGIEKGVGLDMRRWRERYAGYLKRMIGRPCWKIGWVTESDPESLKFQAKAVRIFILPRNHYKFYSRGTAWLDLYFRMT